MSRTTKQKHVRRQVTTGTLELPSEGQQVVRVEASRGNNLHEVSDAKGCRFLVSMPTKFRFNVWIKRGDFVLVEPIAEGDKVKAEIVNVLTRDYVKFYQEEKCWPSEFEMPVDKPVPDGDMFVNTNRDGGLESSSSSSSSSD